VISATTIYFNKETFFLADKQPAYALSFWPFASTTIDLSSALQGTISDEKEIYENKDRMRYKMEAYVTNLQGKVINEFQKYEPDVQFKVCLIDALYNYYKKLNNYINIS